MERYISFVIPNTPKLIKLTSVFGDTPELYLYAKKNAVVELVFETEDDEDKHPHRIVNVCSLQINGDFHFLNYTNIDESKLWKEKIIPIISVCLDQDIIDTLVELEIPFIALEHFDAI